MTNETHNGWTNYATWRIALEIFDGLTVEDLTSPQVEVHADNCESWAEETIFSALKLLDATLIEDYARAFMADVNWQEIADSVNEK